MRAGQSQWGAFFAAALLLAGCAGNKPDPNKIDLTASLLQAAATAQAQTDWLSAANYYRSALAENPDSKVAAIGLMQCLRLVGGLDEASAVADRAVAQAPKDAGVLGEAGKVKLANSRPAEAVDLLKRAIAVDGADWRTRSALGLAYDRLGDYDDADASYRAALKISPDNASILNNYGMSRAMANDLGSARDLLTRAVGTPNADLRVRQNLALVYALMGDMVRAEQLTRQDLPPALANATLDYYRQLAAAAPNAPQQ